MSSDKLRDYGYCVIPKVLDDYAVASALCEVETLFSEEQCLIEKGRRQKDADYLMYCDYGDHLLNLVPKTRSFDALIDHRSAIEPVQSVMNAQCILSQTEMRRPFLRASEGSANVFHRDCCIVTPGLWIIAFWALEDVTPENGPTIIVPRSHRYPIPHGEIPLYAKAGDLILMDAALMHKASAPTKPLSRWMLIFTYCQWWIKPTIDHTKYFSVEEVDRMSEIDRQLFGFTSRPPNDVTKRVMTLKPWEEVRSEWA